MIVNCCASQDLHGQEEKTQSPERPERNEEQVCVCCPSPSCSIQFAVRSSQFAVIHHTNRCWSLINCLFISCFFRIFRIKMTRGVEVLGRLRRTRNRCVFAVHAMPSYMPPYMPSINAINSFGGLSESRSVKTLIYHLGVATSACITSYALAI